MADVEDCANEHPLSDFTPERSQPETNSPALALEYQSLFAWAALEEEIEEWFEG